MKDAAAAPVHPAVVSRIKIMAELDIAQRRLRGRRHSRPRRGPAIDLRVSVMPGNFGEKVVIRSSIRRRSYTISIARISHTQSAAFFAR
jgi:type II secretory ATPase GspE/PulE/Tfp pilus assembly ATPase PilB-like protein